MTREELNHEKQQEIINEHRRNNRKKITLFIFCLSICLICGFLLFYLYTTYISTSRLVVKENRIVDKNLPNSFNGLKVVHFSDLHYGTTVFSDEVKRLVTSINERKPDIVIFSGDLIDLSYKLSTSEQESLIAQLKGIDSSLGKYAVSGEEDTELFYTIMKQSDFNIIENSYDFIYNDNNEPIMLIGLENNSNNTIDVKLFEQINTPNRHIYKIMVMHKPDVFDKLPKELSVNLVLAGHTHNGMVRLPFIGSVYHPEDINKYIDEYYKIGSSHLYISSGIGTNGPGFRLFCRPSFNFFRISNR